MQLDNSTLERLGMLLKGVLARFRKMHPCACYVPNTMAIYEPINGEALNVAPEKGLADATIA